MSTAIGNIRRIAQHRWCDVRQKAIGVVLAVAAPQFCLAVTDRIGIPMFDSDRVGVTVYEAKLDSVAAVWFQLTSERLYSTTGYSIDTQVNVTGDSVIVDLGQIRLLGDIHGQAFTPAMSWTRLPVSDGRYVLALRRSGLIDVFSLVVAQDSICTFPIDTSFSFPAHGCLARLTNAVGE